MKIRDIVSFSKESFFNGAVQTEWFYDDNKVGDIANTYVFHGPKYYGVSSSDVDSGAHRLLDTASFAKNLTDKLYNTKPSNSFVMTIAGYGTGKSHLAVCLGALFSGESNLSDPVIANITSADNDIGAYIKKNITKKNLVIILNGMNNFNLDAEVLRCARLSLNRLGISDNVLQKLTKSYDVAKHFVENMFPLSPNKFNVTAEKYGVNLKDGALKNYLLSHAETDSNVLSIINAVYEEINGDKIAWDRGLSAGDVLLTLQEELCGEDKPLNKILLLFDEFGRYIEYTAANPTVAGEAALQQIFEAIQTANGKIVFSGFIQSELKAYLSRIDKTANITRYIDRYRTACENLFLSSNFETILANILKKNSRDFDITVDGALNKYENFHNKMRSALNRWDRSAIKKSVWTNADLYNSVILKGCYPLHPITVWLLSSSHQWMQQRSTLAFAAEMFDQIAQSEIEGTWLPYIYPVQIIDSNIFNEMLNSEEKGLVPSQYCMLFRDIMVKLGDKLSELDKKILKAILVINMGRMTFLDKNDAITAIKYCSNVSEDDVKHALVSLSEMHGVIVFDEQSKTYDFVAEATGYNEFQRVYAKHRIGVKVAISDIDEDLCRQIGIIEPIETSFGQRNNISSMEWSFNQRLVDSSEITEEYLNSVIKTLTTNLNGENPRGILIHAYCSKDVDGEIKRLSELYKKLNLSEYPIIILFLEDEEKDILSALSIKKTLTKFSLSDRERFKKHINDSQRKQNNNISRKFTSAVTKRLLIGENGLETYMERKNALCTQCFNRLFSKIVPFPFDGFESKSKSQARSALINIGIRLLNRTLMNEQEYSSLTPKEKNRVLAVMSTTSAHSWKIFDEKCILVEPRNLIIKEIVDEVVSVLEDEKRHNVSVLFNKYMLAPYGMNENSVVLLVSYFAAFYGNKYLYTIGNEKLSTKHWYDTKEKPKIVDIRQMNIQKNPNVDVDLVGDLCKKILALNIVDNCSQLKIDLENLLEQEGETDENKFMVAQANAYLDTGIRLFNIIKERYDKLFAIVEDSTKKFSITKVVGAFDKIPNTEGIIEEGYTFVYSEEYKKSVGILAKDLKKLLESYGMTAINKAKCEITELKMFEKTYTNMAKVLRKNGYENYAVAAEERIDVVKTELLAKQYYEKSLIECEKDIELAKSTSKYQDADDLSKKLQGWKSFFEKADQMPDSIKLPLTKRISDAIILVEQLKENLEKIYNDAFWDLCNAKYVSDIRQIDLKLALLLQQQLPEDYVKNLVSAQESIKTAIQFIDRFPEELDALVLLIKELSPEINSYCYNVIMQSATILREEFEREEAEWIGKYIIVAERACNEMSADECNRWLDQTKIVPKYCSNKTVIRYYNARTLVEERLHKKRVEGVLSMYDRLSEAEKVEFKKLIVCR